jgi:hypothetical protein
MKQIAFPFVSLAALGALGLGSAASAAPPSPVSIDLFPTQFCCPEIGTWQATGAITDAGTYVKTATPATPSIPDFCQPEHIGAFREEFTLSGSLGTAVVEAQELDVPTGEFCPPSVGVWEVKSGTGAYAGSSGHGSSQFFKTPVFDLVLTGVMSKAD